MRSARIAAPFVRVGSRTRAPFAFALLVLVGGAASAQTAPATRADPVPWQDVWEHWYTLEIAGATAGWLRETMVTDGARYRATSEMSMRISRGAVDLEISLSSEFVETDDGRPVHLRFVQDMAMQSVDTLWEFHDDHVASTARQGGRTIEARHPLPPEGWLTPMAAHRFVEARRAADADTITYRTIDGELGLTPVTMTHERLGAGEHEFEGRALPVTLWRTTTSAMPGIVATSKLSADGHLLYEEAVLPFGRMVTRVVTRAEALAAAGAPPPELMVTSFVRVAPPIARPRDATSATLRVRTRDGPLPELPSAGAQRVEPAADGRSALLRIDVADNAPAAAGESGRAEYLAASAMVNAEDDLIRKLAAHACRDAAADPAARAEALRRFVHRHISAKSLDTAFATASETARMKAGDCSEHGVLLCALLRAEGIPARVATGLVYADEFAGAQDIFGWHMWTQALVDGCWVDLDATLSRRYDAAHVLTGTASLAEGVGSTDLAALVMLMGNLEIEVLEVGYD